jgi:hypothetical protein
MKRVLLAFLLLASVVTNGQTVLTVGPGQQYLTLNQAYAAIPATISGPYEIHLMAGYSSFSESFPIVFDARNGSSATNTITIIPQFAGATISTAAANTIEFDGCSYLVIDGRVMASGDTANLKIINTNTDQHSILFKNGANNNLVQYSDVMGVNDNSTEGGVVRFGIGNTPNTDNRLYKNLLHSSGASTPDVAIYGTDGNSDNIVEHNYIFDYYRYAFRLTGTINGWQIIDNHVYAGAQVAYLSWFVTINEGVNLISGNYYGGSGPFASGTLAYGGEFLHHYGVLETTVQNNVIKNQSPSVDFYINCPNCLVTNNEIGDTTSTGNIIFRRTISGGSRTLFECARFVDNTVAGIKIVNEGGSGDTEIKVIKVSDECSGNLIGANNLVNSFWVDHTVTCDLRMISRSSSSDFVYADGNRINNVLSENPSSTAGMFLFVDSVVNNSLINVHAENYHIVYLVNEGKTCTNNYFENVSGNYIVHTKGDVRDCSFINCQTAGSTSFPNDVAIVRFVGDVINNTVVDAVSTNVFYSNDFEGDSVCGNNINDVSWIGEDVNGIFIETSVWSETPQPERFVLEENVISGLTADDDHLAHAIQLDYETSDLIPLMCRNNDLNDVYGLRSYGIRIRGDLSPQPDTLEYNHIWNLRGEWNKGIEKYDSPTDESVIRRNVIESFEGVNLSNSAHTTATGIVLSNGMAKVSENLIQGLNPGIPGTKVVGILSPNNAYNNIIRLGIDDNGNSLSNDNEYYGIDMSSVGGEAMYNTIYIGGSNVNGSNNSYCIFGFDNNPITVANNILWNARSNGAGSGTHYTYCNESTINQTVNYNLHYANGNGGQLASFDFGTSSLNSLTDMQNAQVGQHLNSWNSDPLLIAPAADINNWNVAPDVGSDTYGNGVYLPQVTTDYYGYTRSFTPTIGAIENSLWVGVEEAKDEESILVYPNPVKDFLNIESAQGGIQQVDLYNGLGALVLSESGIAAQNKRVDLNGLTAGVYLLVVETEQGVSRTKLVVE